MPFGAQPVCTLCKISSSPIWRKGPNKEVLCNSCGLKQFHKTSLLGTSAGPGTKDGNGGQKTGLGTMGGNGGPVLRKSSRIKPVKKTAQAAPKSVSTKGKGRRVIFKKNAPLKAPAAVSSVVTGESVFHKGQYYQIGDIVSLIDHEGGTYYAQLRGFLSDQYNEKSAVLTWLLPTVRSPHKFDPNTFILGPEEELPRKMEFMEFVCHAPSDYFRARGAPYKTINPEPNMCYIWTSIGPQIRITPSKDEIFGMEGSSNQPLVKERLKSSPGIKERDRFERRKFRVEVLDD